MQTKDETLWKFPEVTYLAGDKLNDHGHSTQLIAQAEEISELTKQLVNRDKQIEELKLKNNELTTQVQQINESKRDLYLKFEDAAQTMMRQVKEDGVELIRKLTRILINKELTNNADIIKEIFENMITRMNDESTITVEVSSHDYAELDKLPHGKPVTLIENMNLKPGDMIVKNNQKGMIFNIDEAISAMLGQ